MNERFSDLWNRIKARGSAEKEFDKLRTMYSEPHRFYHNLTHIESCLADMDIAPNIQQKDIFEFAIFYHDVVYDTSAKDNEEKSAILAYKVCLDAHLPEEFANAASELILVTKHTVAPRGNDARALIDVDLSILGKSPEYFDEYERNIRKEYLWVPEDKFRQARIQILQTFLTRDSIYLTDFYKEKYETQARINLQRSINSLS